MFDDETLCTNDEWSWRMENVGEAQRTHWNVWTLPVEWKNHLQWHIHIKHIHDVIIISTTSHSSWRITTTCNDFGGDMNVFCLLNFTNMAN